MKIYTGLTTCRRCGHSFQWKYTDAGFRPGMGMYAVLSDALEDDGFAKCVHNVIIPGKSEFFSTHCPNCQADVGIECSERIMEELHA